MFSLSIPCRPFPQEGRSRTRNARSVRTSAPSLETNYSNRTNGLTDFGHAQEECQSRPAINPVQVRALVSC